MTIPYKKLHRIFYLLSAIIWPLVAWVNYIYPTRLSSVFLPFYLLLGIAWILYYWQMRKGYIKIDNGILSLNEIFKWRKINLNELVGFKKYAGDYILTSKEGQITISPKTIDDKDLQKLIDELAKYSVGLN